MPSCVLNTCKLGSLSQCLIIYNVKCLLFYLNGTDLRTFSAYMIFNWPAPSTYWCMGLPLRCRNSYFPLLSCRRFLLAQYSSLSRSLSLVTKPPGASCQFLSSANGKCNGQPVFEIWKSHLFHQYSI